MKIEIRKIADKGNIEKERLVLKVTSDTDIGDYVVLQTGYNDGEITIETFYTYWFQYKSALTDDYVVLYTKTGEDKEKTIANGSTAHFFYWGLEDAIWNSDNKAPVVLHAPEWISSHPEEL